MTEKDVTFGTWLRRQRLQLDLTQLELAQQVGCSIVTIRKLERAELRPSKHLVQRLIEVLQIAPAQQATLIAFARRNRAESQFDQISSEPANSSPPLASGLPLHCHQLYARPAAFVGRAHELAEIEAAFTQARLGHGQLRFISGEAGAGKSALLGEFLRSVLVTHPDVVITLGGCDAQTGGADAYLPFREALNFLVNGAPLNTEMHPSSPDSASHLAQLGPWIRQLVVEHGPHLIDTFVPGTLFSLPSGSPKRQTIDQSLLGNLRIAQSQIYEQYVTVLHAIAQRWPLILVLEDLHWADTPSIGLLFRLGRHLAGSRLLVLCTYRSEEMSLGREGEDHPLHPVVAELQRHLGKIVIDLDAVHAQERQALVEALIDSEANRLDRAFRQTLYQHTNGHPLFVVELLRDLQRTGALVKDDTGCWISEAALAWHELPARVEGMIAVRMARLSSEERRSLTIASVVGDRFPAELIAQVQGIETRLLIQQLSGSLQKQHKLIAAEGVEQLQDQRFTYYRFSHNLMRVYLYDRLDQVERVYLHEDVGRALETHYGTQATTLAVQLAYHYTQAGVQEKAVTYLIQAGDQMRNGSANQEALRYYQQALTLMTADEARYDSVLARRALLLIELFRGREAIDDYEQLLHNARQANNQEQEFERLLGLARAHYLVALDDQENRSIGKMHELCLTARALAEQLGNKRYQIQALLTTTWSADFWPENRPTALTQAQQAYRLSRELDDEDLVVASKLAQLNLAPWHEQVQLGEALISELEARQELSRLNIVYFNLMWVHFLLGNFRRAVTCCDTGIALANRIGVLPVMYPTLKACALLGLGRYSEAWAALQQEIADEAHPFSRTFQMMGEGLYHYELSAYSQAIELWETVVVQAKRLDRPWLQSWAQLMIGYALIRSSPAGKVEHKRIAQLLAQVSERVLAGLSIVAASAQQLHAELALAEGRLTECMQHVIACEAIAKDEKDHPRLVTIQELHARLLLAQQQPADALVHCEQALHTATMIDYLPMLWRIHVTKAHALQALKQPMAVTATYQQALAVIELLTDKMTDPDLKRVFLSDPLVASVRLAVSIVLFSTDCEL